MGSFQCQCKAGFPGDGRDCAKLCEIDTHNCPNTAYCTQLSGGQACRCLSGYEGGGTICNDIDECLTNKHDCNVASNFVCQNTGGSFQCVCKEGYVLSSNSQCVKGELNRYQRQFRCYCLMFCFDGVKYGRVPRNSA